MEVNNARKNPSRGLRAALALLLVSACLVVSTLIGANKAWAEDAGQTVWATTYEKNGEYTLAIQTTSAQESTYGSMIEQKQVILPEAGWNMSGIKSEISVQEPQRIVFIGGIKAPSNMADFFLWANYLKAVDLRGLDTSKVTDMEAMFRGCSNLTSIDLPCSDTSNVRNMGFMFGSCKSLTSLDLSCLDTSNVEDMRYMFSSCSGLTSLDLSPLDLSHVLSFNGFLLGADNLKSITLGVGDKIDCSGVCPVEKPLSLVAGDPAVVRVDVERTLYKDGTVSAFTVTALKEGATKLSMAGDQWKYDMDVIVKRTAAKPGSASSSPASSAKPSLANATVTVKDRVWSGKKLTPSVTVKLNGKTLKAGTDYTVTWTSADKSKTAKKAGRYAVTVKGKGAYTGSKQAWFKVTPAAPSKAKAAAAGKKRVKVSWAKPSKKMAAQVSGWQVQIATDKKFTKSVKSVTAKKSAVSATVSKLKKGKTYYVHVRAWAKAGSVKVYSPWSKTVKVKVK